MCKPISITVLITTYNYGRFIGQAIESVLSQDFPQDQVEIVIVDDGSTDDTAQRVEAYGSKVRYLRKTNGGQASALNLGFTHARGEIVALLDADDLFIPNKLKLLAEAFQNNPGVGMVYHPITEWEAKTGERRVLSRNLASGDLRTDPKRFLDYFVQPASASAFRRVCLEPVSPIPVEIRMLADAYWIILVPLIAPILALQEPLTLYRIHGGNSFYAEEAQLSGQAKSVRSGQIQVLMKCLLEWVDGNKLLQDQPYVTYFRKRHSLRLQSLEFELHPPGRWRYFLFLAEQNHTYRWFQTRKFTAFKYLFACLGLVLGHEVAQRWGDRMLGRLR